VLRATSHNTYTLTKQLTKDKLSNPRNNKQRPMKLNYYEASVAIRDGAATSAAVARHSRLDDECGRSEHPQFVYVPADSALSEPPPAEAELLRPHFGDVTVRKYPVILGDQPGFETAGPPLSVDWTPLSETTTSLDEYETNYSPPKARRHEKELLLTPKQRGTILVRIGYEADDIMAASRRARGIRRQERP